jgi:hypothetical protein
VVHAQALQVAVHGVLDVRGRHARLPVFPQVLVTVPRHLHSCALAKEYHASGTRWCSPTLLTRNGCGSYEDCSTPGGLADLPTRTLVQTMTSSRLRSLSQELIYLSVRPCVSAKQAHRPQPAGPASNAAGDKAAGRKWVTLAEAPASHLQRAVSAHKQQL